MFFHVYGPPERFAEQSVVCLSTCGPYFIRRIKNRENATQYLVSESRTPCRTAVQAYRSQSRSAVLFYIDPVLKGTNENS
jgi:hypothetical protein